MHQPRLVGLLIGLAASPALAHFALDAPASSSAQDAYGNPQKSAPCGPALGTGVPTGAVTTVQEGSMLSIVINETIYHPGHYRVSVATEPDLLPADPVVTPGTSQCGSAAIEPIPSLPLLADGLLIHSGPFSGPQTMEVQLPPGLTCENCVLQVVEFMSSHSAPCFYYHCANLQIVSADAGVPDAGAPDAGATADAGTAPEVEPDAGCGCSSSVGAGQLAVMAIVLAALRRRRRSTDR